jgi:hypothetical protein
MVYYSLINMAYKTEIIILSILEKKPRLIRMHIF